LQDREKLRQGWLAPPKGSQVQTSRTLTLFYTEAPSWLRQAHARLDHAVNAAFSWNDEKLKDPVLSPLLSLNAERKPVSEA
jgi:hypothetical protein